MVKPAVVGGLVARATTFVMSSRRASPVSRATYFERGFTAAATLQNNWYDTQTGLWNSTGWWNGGNCLTVLADYALLDPQRAVALPPLDVSLGATGIDFIIANTYHEAGNISPQVQKTRFPSGLIRTTSSFLAKRDGPVQADGFTNFINDYYDDEGWWALGLIRAYDVTGEKEYLSKAAQIFEDMRGGGPTDCGGGIWWSKAKTYVSAISNELYLTVAASLANRMDDKEHYLQVATRQWKWFRNSGLINDDNLVNDGLGSDCKNNGVNTWSYNQGVILGGLVELNKATGDKLLLQTANDIATAAMTALSEDGILHDGCDLADQPDCGSDGAQFKGILMRNLGYLYKAAPQETIKTFILKNADAIWKADRERGTNELGLVYSGPPDAAGSPNAGTHSSAMDAIVAAMLVS